MKGEVDLLYGERNQVGSIMDDIRSQLKAGSEELADLDEQLAEAEAKKNAVAAKLDAARESKDGSSQGYRGYRKLSLTLRDLVEEGRAEEAEAQAEQQVEALLTSLLSDAAFRREYTKMWAAQRKYVVSELLPGSCTSMPATNGVAGPKGGAKGGAPKKPAAPLEPQGAAKAQAIIAAVMKVWHGL